MDPTVVAAWIAAGVSVLTLVGTLAAQYFGRRLTARDADRAFAEQREQLDRTLDAQGRQLDRTLDGQRTRTWNERFATAAEQLGNDKPAVRLAGVYSMAGLADDWSENRQTCVDVLCAYLRMPYDPGSPQDPLMLQASREVRHTITRIITAHLLRDALVSWRGLKFDFTGAVFDTGGFRGAVFSDSWVYFTNARFSAGTVDFGEARFSGAQVDFFGAQFDGGTVNFSHAEFSAGWVGFRDAQFSAGTVDFNFAEFSGGGVDFGGAEFSDGLVDFGAAKFSTGWVSFADAHFSGGTVRFGTADISGGAAYIPAQFNGGLIDFSGAEFSGGRVDFDGALFSGAKVDFHAPLDWSSPPIFPWTDAPPKGVQLPDTRDALVSRL